MSDQPTVTFHEIISPSSNKLLCTDHEISMAPLPKAILQLLSMTECISMYMTLPFMTLQHTLKGLQE